MIRSDPPGALVVLDGKRVGTTPVAVPFHFYGTRDVVLYKSGYELLTASEEISPPMYQYFPIDFLFEFCWPATLRDQQLLNYTLKPHLAATAEERQALQERASDMRRRVLEEK